MAFIYYCRLRYENYFINILSISLSMANAKTTIDKSIYVTEKDAHYSAEFPYFDSEKGFNAFSHVCLMKQLLT